MADRPARRPTTISPELKQRLDVASRALLAVHKALLDHERARYEREHGPVASSGQMLQLVIHDPHFAWLHPLSTAIVRLDELATSSEPSGPADAEAELKSVAAMVRPDLQGSEFNRRYHRLLQESATIAQADTAWRAVVG